MKRVFGFVEAAFDSIYLAGAATIGAILLFDSAGNFPRLLAGVMALVLAGGDGFHLFPRIYAILTGREDQLKRALGRGKQVASITMTLFYVLLWQIGLMLFQSEVMFPWTWVIYILAAVRIGLCLFPQNKWEERYPPLNWGILRNIPFFLLGILTAGLFFQYRSVQPGFVLAWLAILLSFFFYLPVVLWANQKPMIGMLMLPKSCVYLWLLAMCLFL